MKPRKDRRGRRRAAPKKVPEPTPVISSRRSSRRRRRSTTRIKKEPSEDTREKSETVVKTEKDSTRKRSSRPVVDSDEEDETIANAASRSRSKVRSTVNSSDEEENDDLMDVGDDDAEDRNSCAIVGKMAPVSVPFSRDAEIWRETDVEGAEDRPANTVAEYFAGSLTSAENLLLIQMPPSVPFKSENCGSTPLPPGLHGKVRVHRSGKVSIKMNSGTTFNLAKGLPVAIKTKSMAIQYGDARNEQGRKTSGKIVAVEDFRDRLVAYPVISKSFLRNSEKI